MNRPRPGRPSGAALARMVGALCTRPDLWGVALATALRLAAPGWWRHRPYAPLPDGRLWAFRMETAYGRPDADPDAGDLIAFLGWCRAGGRRHRYAGPGDEVAAGESTRLRSTGPG